MSVETPAYELRDHRVLPHDEWVEVRKELLAKEKEFTRARDALSQARRDLPWERVEKDYVFDGPDGKESLADLFAGSSQLIVYHFMFDPGEDEGCAHCSLWADTFDGIPVHLKALDAAFVAISSAPLAKLEAYEKRMGWHFKWLSSFENDFKRDFGAQFTQQEVDEKRAFFNYTVQDPYDTQREGISVFYKDGDGTIYHTYSTFARGIDIVNGAYNFIDMTPKGRDEGEIPQRWVRRHDEYPG
ncbi:MAG TPA: thioredoxin family protein [Candidatus Elarobacter sp.]|jgi:predicted dithiol-disulfide oxidoreductase (DUF899 family)|nr:thioredoxin family protein [Candidatus Elarobacter sp.]